MWFCQGTPTADLHVNGCWLNCPEEGSTIEKHLTFDIHRTKLNMTAPGQKRTFVNRRWRF